MPVQFLSLWHILYMDKLIEKRVNEGVLQKRKQSSNSAGTIRSLNIRTYSQLNINVQIFAWAFGTLIWTSCYIDGIYCLVHVFSCVYAFLLCVIRCLLGR